MLIGTVSIVQHGGADAGVAHNGDFRHRLGLEPPGGAAIGIDPILGDTGLAVGGADLPVVGLAGSQVGQRHAAAVDAHPIRIVVPTGFIQLDAVLVLIGAAGGAPAERGIGGVQARLAIGRGGLCKAAGSGGGSARLGRGAGWCRDALPNRQTGARRIVRALEKLKGKIDTRRMRIDVLDPVRGVHDVVGGPAGFGKLGIGVEVRDGLGQTGGELLGGCEPFARERKGIPVETGADVLSCQTQVCPGETRSQGGCREALAWAGEQPAMLRLSGQPMPGRKQDMFFERMRTL